MVGKAEANHSDKREEETIKLNLKQKGLKTINRRVFIFTSEIS